MPYTFLSNVNLSKNELQNAVVHKLASAPASPVTGQLYYNTGDDNLYVFDGVGWVDLTIQGGGISYGIPSATINAGDSAAEGVSTNVLRADAQFAVSTGAASTLSSGSTNTEGVSTALARADHTHSVTGLHTQNTDTGTSSSTFFLTGNAITDVAVKKESSGVLAIRLGDDSAYADLKADDLTVAGNLTVQGTTTTVSSETLTVADNIIELNSNIATTAASTEDGGVFIRRYTGADVLQAAQLLWQESSDRWTTVQPASSGTGTVQKAVALKHVETLGAVTGGTPITVTHNLNTQDVVVEVRQVSDNSLVYVDTIASTVDTVNLTFAASVAANSFIVTVVG